MLKTRSGGFFYACCFLFSPLEKQTQLRCFNPKITPASGANGGKSVWCLV
jgi:hypothetical protein